uniref:Uncharacterized protein n=1 Tax=Pararge aegeria TaxID=116150 RepID=S4P589_9NEOP
MRNLPSIFILLQIKIVSVILNNLSLSYQIQKKSDMLFKRLGRSNFITNYQLNMEFTKTVKQVILTEIQNSILFHG